MRIMWHFILDYWRLMRGVPLSTESMKVVVPKDWYLVGFDDGQNGNSRWMPSGPGSSESRKAYLNGFYAGYADLKHKSY